MLLKERPDGRVELTVSLSQLKNTYVAMFRQLHAGGMSVDALDEDDMLLTLQTFLQRKAAAAGVDATIHAEWEAFLGVRGAPSCEQRFGHRDAET
ncbi:MAG: hypothetical protein CHACPFDD_02316 [Phycisphaerae bacterium]|nr:hypothetical protein [Phycisphaerae bacterium]